MLITQMISNYGAPQMDRFFFFEDASTAWPNTMGGWVAAECGDHAKMTAMDWLVYTSDAADDRSRVGRGVWRVYNTKRLVQVASATDMYESE